MVITIASMAGFMTPPQLVDYCCTKTAAVAFHEGLAAELLTRYKAPRVRTLCICPSWARTKLAAGVTNKSTFLSPTLEPGTIADAVVQGVLEGKSGLVHLPRVHQWFGGTVRGWPWWLQVGMRNKSSDAMKTFVGYGERRRTGTEYTGREDEIKGEGEGEEKIKGNVEEKPF